jgi:hypothetical protein
MERIDKKMRKQLYLALLLVLLLIIFYLSYVYFRECKEISFVTRRIERADNISTDFGPLFTIIADYIVPAPPDSTIKLAGSKAPTADKKNPEKYFNEIQTHNNDTQNVHNSLIISGLSKKLTRLKELVEKSQVDLSSLGVNGEEAQNIKIHESLTQIKQFAQGHYIRDNIRDTEKINKIKFILKKIRNGDLIVSINILSSDTAIKESYILSLIWERIHHPENAEKAHDMKVALLDNLVDAVITSTHNIFNIIDIQIGEFSGQKYRLECITGRVGRMLASLTLVDADKILSEPERDEKEFENEAYYKAHNILHSQLQKESEQLREDYIADREKIEKKRLKHLLEFENSVKEQINITLLKDYENILELSSLKNIIQKAQEGV